MQQSSPELRENGGEIDLERSLIVSRLPPTISEALLLQEVAYRSHVVEIRIIPHSENDSTTMKAFLVFENSHFATEQLKLTPSLNIGNFQCPCEIQLLESSSANEDENSEERRRKRGKRTRSSVGEMSSVVGSRRGSKRSIKSMASQGPDPSVSGLSGWIKEKQTSLRIPLTADSVITHIESLSRQNMHQAAYTYFLEHMELIQNKVLCEKMLNDLLANVRQHWLSLSPRIASSAQIGSPVHVCFEGGHILIQKNPKETNLSNSNSAFLSPSSCDSSGPQFSPSSSSHLAREQDPMSGQSPSRSQQSSPRHFDSLSSLSSPAHSPLTHDDGQTLDHHAFFSSDKLVDSSELAQNDPSPSRSPQASSSDSMEFHILNGDHVDESKMRHPSMRSETGETKLQYQNQISPVLGSPIFYHHHLTQTSNPSNFSIPYAGNLPGHSQDVRTHLPPTSHSHYGLHQPSSLSFTTPIPFSDPRVVNISPNYSIQPMNLPQNPSSTESLSEPPNRLAWRSMVRMDES